MLVQPAFGWLGDKIGRKSLLIAAFGSITVLTFPVMSLIAGSSTPLAALGLVIALLLMLSGYTATNAVVKSELFPTHIRALGVALPYALANAVFGGTAEYVAQGLKYLGEHGPLRLGAFSIPVHENWFYAYVSVVALAATLVAIRMRDTSVHSLIEED
jgi:MHS family alpha-ketoglutarate permease-like MFS transporter